MTWLSSSSARLEASVAATLGTLPIDDEGHKSESFGTLSAPLTMQKDRRHHENFTSLLFQEQKVFFKCKEGHSGQFVYIRDDRSDKEYFGLCEVEVFHFKGKQTQDP